MLVLSRKVGEKIVIGDNITVTLVRLAGNRVAIGVDAPDRVRVVRGEIMEGAGPSQRPDKPDPSTSDSVTSGSAAADSQRMEVLAP